MLSILIKFCEGNSIVSMREKLLVNSFINCCEPNRELAFSNMECKTKNDSIQKNHPKNNGF